MRLMLACLVVLLSLEALAQTDPRVAFLERQLAQGRDPRVRAQAALLLGASQEPSARQPLCAALGDPVPIVRIAGAKALIQLQDPAALGCLAERREDPDPDARAELERAIGALTAVRDRRPQMYVALLPPSGSVPTTLLHFAEDRIRARLRQLGAKLAPDREDKTRARAVLRSERLKGFALRPNLTQAGSGLRLELLCFSYPDRALLGEVDVSASGANPPDLIRALVPRALEEAGETLNWSEP